MPDNKRPRPDKGSSRGEEVRKREAGHTGTPKDRPDFTLKKLLFNFAALADLGEETTSNKDFNRVMKSSLYLLMGTLSVSKGIIFEYNHNYRTLKPVSFKGFDIEEGFQIPISQQAMEVLKDENRICRFNINSPYFADTKRLWATLMPAILMPMVVKDRFIGAIALGEKFSREDYTEDDFTVLSIMAKHIGIFIYNHHLLSTLARKVEENKRLYENLQIIYNDTVQAFAAAIDAKDAYTKGHSRRVARYCVALAEELGLSRRELEGLKVAGFLHDIGKIAIDKDIINKPSSLSAEERVELNQHPLISYEILSRVRFPWKDLPLSVRYHHERIDGKGYPDRLTGEEIPLYAKIMALADAFDAMTTDRPYRRRLPLESVLIEVKKEIGRQFDPIVARTLFGLIKKELKGETKNLKILSMVGSNFNPSLMEKIFKRLGL